MAEKYRIVSDGSKTDIFAPNGEKVKNVIDLEITQGNGRFLSAKVTLFLIQPELDLVIEAKNV